MGTRCCAPKSLIREASGSKEDSDESSSQQSTLQIFPTSVSTTTAPATVDLTVKSKKSTRALSIIKCVFFLATTSPTRTSVPSRPTVYSKYVCGVKGTSRNARVVGGEDSDQGEWCWQVALINPFNQYLCGAALIGSEWVLTAAHCVTK